MLSERKLLSRLNCDPWSENGFEGWNSVLEGLAEVGGVGSSEGAGERDFGASAADCLGLERRLRLPKKLRLFGGDDSGEEDGENLDWLMGRGAALYEDAMPLS